jgi:cytochrome c oxidase assembly protein subunit 15
VQPKPFNAKLHLLALAAAIATFPLIYLGGLVTSHHAGMSVPDWPNTWGYNMFTFPPSQWVGGIFYEHTHRLLAAFIGLLAIAMVIVACRTDRRRWVRYNAIAILLAVLVQGTLGGLRVVLDELDLAIVHACAAQIFFCYVATFCVMTSRFWSDRAALDRRQCAAAGRIFPLAAATFAIIVAQLVIAAIMRHKNAGLAIPDFPASFGKILPPRVVDDAFRQQAIHRYGVDLELNRVTAFQIWIHFAHRIGALLVSIAVVWLSTSILRHLRPIQPLTRPAAALLALLPIQLVLGMMTIWQRKPADVASLHVAVGSLILVTAVVIALRCYGLTRSARPANFSRQAHGPGAVEPALS